MIVATVCPALIPRSLVLNDQSCLYADLGGPGSVVAARMAVEDAGGAVLSKPVEIVFADHQNKSDVGAAIAREWFEVGKVDMAIGFNYSAVALAVEQLAAEKNRIAIAGAVGSTAFTGKSCTPTEASWLYDSYALTTSLAKAIVAEGRDTWFFITVDYAFGHSLEADATSAVKAAGGKVLGSVRQSGRRTSALMRIPDSSRTSREVRKVHASIGHRSSFNKSSGPGNDTDLTCRAAVKKKRDLVAEIGDAEATFLYPFGV